jgi:hypothetical protein
MLIIKTVLDPARGGRVVEAEVCSGSWFIPTVGAARTL